jgi:hypothetical protein
MLSDNGIKRSRGHLLWISLTFIVAPRRIKQFKRGKNPSPSQAVRDEAK